MATSRPTHGSAFAYPASAQRVQSTLRPLPNGACSHRHPSAGPCGCHQFWDKGSTELHEGSAVTRPNSERSTWCVCGHHACFHKLESIVERPVQQQPIASRSFNQSDGHGRLPTPSQPDLPIPIKKPEESSAANGSRKPIFGRARDSPLLRSQRSMPPMASQANAVVSTSQQGRAVSLCSSTGLPRIPSVCIWNSHELRGVQTSQNQRLYESLSQTYQGPDGLGLFNIANSGDQIGLQNSLTSTVPDEADKQNSGPRSESELPSTRANSTIGDNVQQFAQAPGSFNTGMDFTHLLPPLEIGDTVPNTLNQEEFLQSATEMATPSNSNTPDLNLADRAVRESTVLVEALTRILNQEPSGAAQSQPNNSTSGTVPTVRLTGSSSTTQEQLQQAIKTAPPQVLQRIISYLAPLHNLLSSMPNVANTLNDLAARLELVEQNSFNQGPINEVVHPYDDLEVRLLELEERMNAHDKLHEAIDADNSSRDVLSRHRIVATTESFGSNHSISGRSTTSSALIVAAMDRKEIETEFQGIKGRLDALEAVAMPSFTDPWEVEVVLLPWGRELRGIWHTPNEPMQDSCKSVAQDTEEWTQSRSLRKSSRSSLPFSETEDGWSSQAISDWADTMEEWLSPKACGTNNLVYKRLQSRGFIRNTVLKSANSADIQMVLSKAFHDLLENLEYSDGHGLDGVESVHSYPGLRASFIPLRKVMKSSRLRFLTHAEMSSSALWNAQFLASGVMMRVSGGRKRLYVTQREAYIQQSTAPECSWTWQRLRELPRYSPSSDFQTRSNNEIQSGVAEADAKEACWAHYPAYDDPPASVTSSFSSSHSAQQLTFRPAAEPRQQWPRAVTPTSILKNKQQQQQQQQKSHQPISPLSIFHPKPQSQSQSQSQQNQRPRTVSASQIEREAPASAQKRRLANSFDHAVSAQTGAHQQSGSQSSQPGHHHHHNQDSLNAEATTSNPKRRRLSHSPNPSVPIHHNNTNNNTNTNTNNNPNDKNDSRAAVQIWTTHTPRRSREPPSPFFSSHPDLPTRRSSGGSGRSSGSGRSDASGERSGSGFGRQRTQTPSAFAYATPYSGPGFMGFDGEDQGVGLGTESGGDTEVDDTSGEEGEGEEGGSWKGVGSERAEGESGSEEGEVERSSDVDVDDEGDDEDDDDDAADFSGEEEAGFGSEEFMEDSEEGEGGDGDAGVLLRLLRQEGYRVYGDGDDDGDMN